MPKRRRPPGPTGPLETSEQVLRVLAGIEEHVDQILEPVRDNFQETLRGLVGKTFGSFEANHQVARQVQQLLHRLRRGVECQRPGCGKPARLRCVPAAGTRGGTFQFEHYVGGRQTRHGGWSKLPPLTLVPVEDEDHRRRGPVIGTERE